MKIGTRSVLFGVHQFMIHPFMVFLAWRRLYGFPYDPRLWFCFFFHDFGYIGKPNMDGPEGESHPEFGARFANLLFGPAWANFSLYHSRFYSRREARGVSQLCVADKLAFCYYPKWLFLALARATGEMAEYYRLDGRNPGLKPWTNESEWVDSYHAYGIKLAARLDKSYYNYLFPKRFKRKR